MYARTKKGSLSLSTNAIVVLILAVVMLGIGLGFITTMMDKVTRTVETQIPGAPEPSPADGDTPVTVSGKLIIKSGGFENINVGVYNPFAAGTTPTQGVAIPETATELYVTFKIDDCDTEINPSKTKYSSCKPLEFQKNIILGGVIWAKGTSEEIATLCTLTAYYYNDKGTCTAGNANTEVATKSTDLSLMIQS